jgi:hypothetical protein
MARSCLPSTIRAANVSATVDSLALDEFTLDLMAKALAFGVSRLVAFDSGMGERADIGSVAMPSRSQPTLLLSDF